MLLRHILMTRFNLPTLGREVAFRTRPGWLEERMEIFTSICCPSVAAQTEQHFAWLVYLDRDSPLWVRRRIDALRGLRDFHPCYTGLFDAGGWARTVRELTGPAEPAGWLITSNLDNDDALAVDYMARVRQAAETRIARSAPDGNGVDPGRFAVNCPDGYVLAGRRLFAHRHLQNAFTNLVERDDGNIATTMTIRHMELAAHVPVVQANGPPAWLQLVHDSNVSNRIRGDRVAPPPPDGRFASSLFASVEAPSRAVGLVERWLIAPLRRVRDHVFAWIRQFVRADPG